MNLIECPECGSPECRPTSPPDEAGVCEYHCGNCGEYFTDDCEELEKVQAEQ